jgi:hypothetical protein
MSLSAEDALMVFVIALSASTVLAALQELREGRWAGLRVGERLARGGIVTDQTVGFIRWVMKLTIMMRVAFPILVILGIAPRVSAILTAMSLLMSILIRFKHNTLFMAAGMAILACGPSLPTPWSDSADVSPWTLGAVSVLISGVYLGGAVTKLQSEQFRSGATLYVIFTARFGRHDWVYRIRSVSWGCAAQVVIMSEMLLTGLVAFPGALALALGVGGVLHASFALIQPGRLVPFQLAALGAYPAASAGFALLW